MFQGVASFLNIPMGVYFNGDAPNSSLTLHGNLESRTQSFYSSKKDSYTLGGKEENLKAVPLVFRV